MYVCMYVQVIIWEEDDDDKWLGAGPQIELKYDDRYNFLLSAGITRGSLSF